MNDSELRERLLDLLVSEAVFGLTEDERNELERLKASFPEWGDDESLNLTVGAIQLVSNSPEEQLPRHLESAILEGYERTFSVRSVRTEVGQTDGGLLDFLTARWLGWAVAGCLAATMLADSFFYRPQPEPVMTASAERQNLLTGSQDVLVITWAEADDKHPLNLSGDIVWSNAQQRGFMRFNGLPVNDKKRECYQLWIFDANQSEKTPVDGGVFNVDSDGEIVVPVDAKLIISKPTLFAVTVEKPGGVVVSSRERLTAVAKVGI